VSCGFDEVSLVNSAVLMNNFFRGFTRCCQFICKKESELVDFVVPVNVVKCLAWGASAERY